MGAWQRLMPLTTSQAARLVVGPLASPRAAAHVAERLSTDVVRGVFSPSIRQGRPRHLWDYRDVVALWALIEFKLWASKRGGLSNAQAAGYRLAIADVWLAVHSSSGEFLFLVDGTTAFLSQTADLVLLLRQTSPNSVIQSLRIPEPYLSYLNATTVQESAHAS